MPADVPFLVSLAQSLTESLAPLSAERRERHRSFVWRQQRPDGGFGGRDGDSDLYYTAFAVRSLGLLGAMSPAECEPIARYLAGHNWRSLSLIDLLNYAHTALALQSFGGIDRFADEPAGWEDDLCRRVESVRTTDGGYAKSPEGASGSTYHSFLVILTYELLGRDVPLPNRLIQFLYDRQRDDGGFVEIEPMKRSGTNPTAAAAETLRILKALDDDLRREIRNFLIDVRSGDGGFQANTRIPFPDGLSTFTGLLTLRDIGFPPDSVIPREHVARFVQDSELGLEFPTGGFRAAAWDQSADVEYTFYGLGILALLGPDYYRTGSR